MILTARRLRRTCMFCNGWTAEARVSAPMASPCAGPSDCLGLPNASSSTHGVSAPEWSSRATYVSYFRARPGDYYPHWGGATGFASRLVSAAKRHASFAAVVDVGCNTGEWSRAWLGRDGGGGRDKTGMLLCLEPVPALAAATKKRLSVLPGGDRVHVLNLALSNVSGTQPIFGLPADSRFASSQTGAGLSKAPSEGSHVELGVVPVRTLDSVLRSWRLLSGGRLLVKIDTEGFDVHVLAGAACALRSGAIDVLQLEWNRRKLRSAAPACVTLRRVAVLLEQLGYEAYLVGRPYIPLNFGMWHNSYEAAALPCPPRCTGDVVALRRDFVGREAMARELLRPPMPAKGRGSLTLSRTRTPTGTRGRGRRL